MIFFFVDESGQPIGNLKAKLIFSYFMMLFIYILSEQISIKYYVYPVFVYLVSYLNWFSQTNLNEICILRIHIPIMNFDITSIFHFSLLSSVKLDL